MAGRGPWDRESGADVVDSGGRDEKRPPVTRRGFRALRLRPAAASETPPEFVLRRGSVGYDSSMAVSVEQTLTQLRARGQAAKRRAETRAAELRGRAPEAAAELRRFGAQNVWLFGSLATGDVWAGSDVDLAVRGLAVVEQFAALAAVERVLGAPADLLLLEEAPPSLVERVLAEGIRL